LGPFRHASYRAYWVGVAFNNMGTWIQAVAGSVFVYQLTGSSLSVGIFNFIGFIPILVFSIPGGRASDRYDRRRIVVVTNLVSALIIFALTGLTWAGQADETALIVATFLVNILWAFSKPALQALIPNIVPREDLRDAVAMSSLGFQTGQMAGPLIAALALAVSGPALAFGLNAMTYVGLASAMLLLYRTGAGEPSAADRRSQAGESAANSSTAFLRANPWAVALIIVVAVCTIGMEIQRSLAPALVEERLGLAASVVGLVVTAQTVGGFLGLLIFVPIRQHGWGERAAVLGLVLEAVGVALFAFSSDLAVISVGFFSLGVGVSLTFPVVTAALQLWTPDGLRGRIMAYHQMSQLGHRPLTAIALGGIATGVGLTAGLAAWLVLAPLGLAAILYAWRHIPEGHGEI
jgi:MFS family permease